MSVYSITLKLLSPLHIGDGLELRQDFDFVVHEGRTYRLDEDAVLAAKQDSLKRDASGRFPPPGRLLSASDYTNPALFRYVLRGAPRSRKVDARLRSFIKDVYDRPYIPGSSLKGALRTALAWTAWQAVNPRLDRAAVGRRREWAAQPLERKIFGPDPNHDLLRALHVSDLHGPRRPGEGLIIANAQVFTRLQGQAPIELEALQPDSVLHGSLTVDETLFAPWAEQTLHFSARRPWLDELLPRLRRHSAARIQRLAGWFEHLQQANAVAGFYRQLLSAKLPPNQAFLQLGWGTGWDGKTFWTHLQKDAELFEALVRDFRMHKAAPGSPRRKPGDPFPRSRRAAVGRDGRPAAPFGWVLLEISPAR